MDKLSSTDPSRNCLIALAAFAATPTQASKDSCMLNQIRELRLHCVINTLEYDWLRSASESG